MTTTVLLAFTAAATGAPACLLPSEPDGSTPLVARLARTAAAFGPVTVLTPGDWVGSITTATADIEVASGRLGGRRVEVLATDGAVAGLDWLADPTRCRVSRSDGLAVVQAHLGVDDVALGAVLDGAGPTGILSMPVERRPQAADDHTPAGSNMPAGTTEIRVIRGRVVAASSAAHRVSAPTHLGLGALHLDAGAVEPARAAARACREAIEAGRLPDDPDLVAWSTVALVRAGHRVGPIAVPRLGVARLVTTPTDAMHVAGRRRARTAERVRLDHSVKRDDGFFTTYFVSTYSPRLARLAARIGLTPDAVTWLSMLLGAVAAGLFASGDRIAWIVGAVVLQAAFTLDCVDGQLARYTRRFTIRGAWLDSMFDRGKEYLVYAGLAVGGVRAGDELGLWLLAGAALALQTFRHTLDLGYAEQQAADVDREVRRPLVDTGGDEPGFWEPGHHDVEVATEPTPDPPTPSPATGASPPGSSTVATPAGSSLPARVILALRRVEHVPGLRWVKRIVTLPIGERFALISVLAATTTPRTTFLALLVWGGLAAAYTAGGRLVRSIA